MDDASIGKPRSNIDLVVGLFALFSDNLNVLRNWGLYLFAQDFNGEPELRNKIGTIWLTSLLDSLEGELRSLDKYRQQATERDLPHLLQVCDQASLFMECIKEILGRYSRTEQLFLNDMRDQLVHSWIARRHSDEFPIKYFDGKSIAKERITWAEHGEIMRSFYLTNVLDQTLLELLGRARDLRLRYWHVVDELLRISKLEGLQDEMLSGRPFRIDALTRPITGPVAFSFG